jgi:hypothetical protein
MAVQDKNQKQKQCFKPSNYFELSKLATETEEPLSQILNQLQKLQLESQQTHGVSLF